MPIALLDVEDFLSDSYKVAALYFDRLAVAVPARPHPSREELYKRTFTPLSDAGILDVIRITGNDMNDAAMPLVKVLALHEKELRRKFEFSEGWPRDGRRVGFWQGWYPEILSSTLEETRLGYVKPYLADETEWLMRTTDIIGQVYRSALIDLIAQRNLFTIAGESDCAFPGASSWRQDIITNVLLSQDGFYLSEITPDRAIAMLALLAVRTVLPSDLNSLTLEVILELRRRNRAQLTVFQEFLGSTVRSGEFAELLGRRSSLSTLQKYIDIEYERKIEPEAKRLDNAYRKLGLETVWSSISLKAAVPPAIAAAINTIIPGGGLAHGVMLGTGVAVGAMNILKESYSAFQRLRDSPTAYLHALGKKDPLTLVHIFQKARPRPQLGPKE